MGKLELWEAVATMIGMIIGAGILGIPYVIAKAGFLTGMLNIIIIGVVVMIMYLYLGEIVLRTKGKHQLTGYAEKYLGKWGKRIMAFSMVFGLYGILTAYIIGEGSALSSILGGSETMYILFFFIIVATLTYFGLEVMEKAELFTIVIIFLVVAVIISFTYPHINTSNLTTFNIKNFFIPFGVVLFAFLGFISVPEASEILRKDKRKLKKAIIIGLSVPILLYIVFAFVVVGSVGLENFNVLEPNQRIATIALGKIISPTLFVIANLFAVFAMFTSFIAVAFAMKEMYMYDYGINKKVAWALTCIIPLIMALSGLTNFIQALNVVGVVAGGIDAVLIALMFHKAKKIGERNPEYTIRESKILSVVLVALFVAGAVFLLI